MNVVEMIQNIEQALLETHREKLHLLAVAKQTEELLTPDETKELFFGLELACGHQF